MSVATEAATEPISLLSYERIETIVTGQWSCLPSPQQCLLQSQVYSKSVTVPSCCDPTSFLGTTVASSSAIILPLNENLTCCPVLSRKDTWILPGSAHSCSVEGSGMLAFPGAPGEVLICPLVSNRSTDKNQGLRTHLSWV